MAHTITDTLKIALGQLNPVLGDLEGNAQKLRTARARAAEAGVDRSVITRLRVVARDGAIAALQASRPGRPRQSREEASEAAALRAEVDRLQSTVVEQAVELAVLRGKSRWG